MNEKSFITNTTSNWGKGSICFGFNLSGRISGSDKNKQGSISAALSNWVGTNGQLSNSWIEDLLKFKGLNM